jgi:hypothetical protein
MKAILRIFFLFLFSTIASSSVVCGQGVADSISQSHIDGNVPDKKDFHNFLARDLESYFNASLKKTVRADYELLRDAPTQTGIAYPKYYAWVKVFDGDKLIEEGAVRLAAIEKKRFEVTDYLSKANIERSPATIERVFPKALIEAIRKKAGL